MNLYLIHSYVVRKKDTVQLHINFIAKKKKKRKFLKVDRGIYFKSCVLKLTDITKQNELRSRLLYSFLAIDW